MRHLNPQPSLFTRAVAAAKAAVDVGLEILEETKPVHVKLEKPEGSKSSFGIPAASAPRKFQVKQIVLRQGEKPETTTELCDLDYMAEAKEFCLALARQNIPNQAFADTDGFVLVVTADATYMFYQV